MSLGDPVSETFRVLPGAAYPLPPRSIRVLRVLSAVLLAFAVVAAMCALVWAASIGLERLGRPDMIPAAMVLVGFGFAMLARRLKL